MSFALDRTGSFLGARENRTAWDRDEESDPFSGFACAPLAAGWL